MHTIYIHIHISTNYLPTYIVCSILYFYFIILLYLILHQTIGKDVFLIIHNLYYSYMCVMHCILSMYKTKRHMCVCMDTRCIIQNIYLFLRFFLRLISYFSGKYLRYISRFKLKEKNRVLIFT